MQHERRTTLASTALSILVAIGCGGGKPQDASATTETGAKASAPTQLAQAPPAAQAPASAKGSSVIRGTVQFTGKTPAPSAIKMDADPQCQLQHKAPVQKEDVIVNSNGTLKYVFVYVKQGLEGKIFPAPSTPVILDQQGCLYHPHILGIQVKQPLEIVNNDATLHNVNCKPTKSKPFNIAQPAKGMKSTKTFTAPEIMVKCACNVHPWMATYLGVLDHPYFSITGDDGSFVLSGLPAGQYTIEAWHEKYGTQTQTVSVGEGETKQVAFAFKGE